MFNDKYGLTDAVLQGSKTMTRRVITPQYETIKEYNANCETYLLGELEGDTFEVKPRYYIGEKVAVAQCYGTVLEEMIESKCGYGEDENEFYEIYKDTPGWKNKMFVKAYLMPHTIRITDIKVERLQDISDEDCMREGIIRRDDMINSNMEDIVRYTFEGSFENHIWKAYKSPRQAFAALIDKVSGKGTWERNPFVIAYGFELVK